MEIIEQNQNTQLKKHVGTVHTSAPLTLLQRKAFSILVFNAYPRLLQDKSHTIPLDVLCDLIGFDSKNTKALEDSLEELAKTVIRWEEGEGKNRKWAITTFCAHAIIEKGQCHYEFSDFLSQQLYKPEIYARININTLRDFQSRYGLALYENCARYRPNKDFRGGTPEWPLDQFRRLMGISGTTLYDTFKRLNERIIKPAVIEVNSCSDILIEPRFIRSARSVVAVAFSVQDNPQLKLNFNHDSVEHPLVIEVNERYKVPMMKAVEWLEAHGEERFREVLKMTNDLVAQGKAKSPVGFMRKAFEENYQPTVDVDAERKKIRMQKASEEQVRKAAERRLELKKQAENELDRIYHDHLSELALIRFKALPEAEQDFHLEELGQQNGFFRDGFAKRGKEGVLEGSLNILFTHYLEETWNLKASLPLETWQRETGYRVEETPKGFSVIKSDAS